MIGDAPLARPGLPLFERAPLSDVRGLIARLMLDDVPAGERLGGITLHPHQASAARRIGLLLDRHGGALLSDVVGLGKTYAALAVAAQRGPLLVIAPAGLRAMWSDAFARAGVRGDLVSFEALSRGRRMRDLHRIVIIDEAHHVRNPSTRRYDGVARACAHADVLLLSATPLHNSRADVAALLALFLGSRAYELTDEEVAHFVVRRTMTDDAPTLPGVAAAPSRTIIRDETVLDTILALPPPVPPRGGAVAPRLLTIGLVRQWVSSTAALASALRRRIAQGEAILAALETGRYPDARELGAWALAEDALQLAFPELLPDAAGTAAEAAAELMTVVRAHVVGARMLRASLVDDASDRARAAFIREIIHAHPGEKIVAFTAYTETARALYGALRRDGRVALLTAHGGTVAGGSLTRNDVLRCFAPRAAGVAPPRAADDIALLVATDLLSEGVNLQDASVVVHLDLPWTPARLAQRTGRVARLGAAREIVTSYTIEPPPRADAWLRSQEILARKSAAATRMLGADRGVPSTPVLASDAADEGCSSVASAERIRQMLRTVLARPAHDEPPRSSGAVVAGIRAAALPGRALVAIRDAFHVVLIAVAHDGTLTSSSAVVQSFVAAALDGEDALPSDADAVEVLAAVERWSDRRRAAAAAGVAECPPVAGDARGAAVVARATRARHAVVRHAASFGVTTPFARRAALAELAERIRHAAARAIPIAIERDIRALSPGAITSDDTERLATLVAQLDERTRRPASAASPEVLAAILFVPHS